MLCFFLCFSSPKIYFYEDFNDMDSLDRWQKPKKIKKGVLVGKMSISSGDFYGDERKQRGLITLENNRFYLITANFSRTMDTRFTDLVVQYTVKMNFHVDCSGQYIKLLDTNQNISSFSNETDFSVMFGPDVCGPTFRKLHIILRKNGVEYPTLRPLNCIKDHLTHSYTLIIRKNNTMCVKIDGEVVDEAPLSERFNIPVIDEIPDPNDKKPDDWEDDEFILDPNDKKPDDWVDKEFIPDPDSSIPDGWDPNVKWSPPLIRNPKYKGQWKQAVIKNPKYKGVWKPKLISERSLDPDFGHFSNLNFIGIEVKQHVAGSIFDNFYVGDSEEEAQKLLEENFLSIRQAEVEDFDQRSREESLKREIEDAKRDSGRNFDHDKFATADADEERDYFERRKEYLERKRKNDQRPPKQFDDL